MKIVENHLDVINELMNIGIGDAASMLNEMVNCHVTLMTPKTNVVSREVLKDSLGESLSHELSMVEMRFSGSMNGVANLLFPLESGKKLTNILSDEFEDEDYNSLKAGTLTEVGNIILNSVLASFSNQMNLSLEYSIPMFRDLDLDQYAAQELFEPEKGSEIFLCEVNFSAEDIDIDGQVIIVFDVLSLEKMFQNLGVS
ncbi:hypothetical protein A9Q84_15100 [Halobacteriovorax marinus]|uniref:CheC-like protein domain-containing protein n=1 Tax=Halobacteriovorax marinus TaxID=97084 RepID=A0A1Y5F976_9BACT|nr:hypothetical protein A9Q84_15100 [Halobacteriovorax marinus]